MEWNCIGIWESGIKALADAININQTLEELDLRNNKVGSQGGVVLANALKTNSSLRRLGSIFSIFLRTHDRFAMEHCWINWWSGIFGDSQMEPLYLVPRPGWE